MFYQTSWLCFALSMCLVFSFACGGGDPPPPLTNPIQNFQEPEIEDPLTPAQRKCVESNGNFSIEIGILTDLSQELCRIKDAVGNEIGICPTAELLSGGPDYLENTCKRCGIWSVDQNKCQLKREIVIAR